MKVIRLRCDTVGFHCGQTVRVQTYDGCDYVKVVSIPNESVLVCRRLRWYERAVRWLTPYFYEYGRRVKAAVIGRDP